MPIGRLFLPLWRFSMSLRWPDRLGGTLSVRARIVVLALIPVIGFAANGITYVSGEREVGHSFATANGSRELADASRDFKIAVAAMRIAVKNFAVAPHGTLIDDFRAAQAAARKNLILIERSIGGRDADDIAALARHSPNSRAISTNW